MWLTDSVEGVQHGLASPLDKRTEVRKSTDMKKSALSAQKPNAVAKGLQRNAKLKNGD